jgi:hypothetical protein
VKRQRRGIDAKVKSDGAADHHDEQEGLGSQELKIRSHKHGNKQTAGSPGHRKPEALQKVGKSPHAGSHRGNPARMIKAEC